MSAETPARPRSRRHLGRWIALVLTLAVVVMGLLFVRDLMKARDSFNSVMAELPAVQQALLDGDDEEFDDLIGGLQRATADARASTDGPLWWLASKVPVIGGNAAALTLVAEVLDDVAVEVLPNLADAGAVLIDGGLQITNSTIDLEPIREAAPPLAAAYDTVVEADDRLQQFDASNLVAEIAGPFDQAEAGLSDLRAIVTTGRNLTSLLPPMLGGDGPRQYLVLAQSNAELRATGGIPGALLLISADDGVIAMERTATASEVGPFSEPVLPLRPDDLALYGEGLGRFIQDVTMTPQFPVGAEIAAEMWEQSQGGTIDGVIAVDPVVLSFLLDQIGPIAVGEETLDAGNVVDILLSEVYLTYPDPDEADALFADVASAVMSSVLAGQADPGDLLDAMTRGAEERRLLIWSAHSTEQELLTEGGFGGDFAATPSTVGIFLNDATRGKMGYYLDAEISLVGSSCTDAGRVDTIELRLSSTLSAESAHALPSYVTGVDLPAELAGTIRTNIGLYSAAGGQVINIYRDDVAIGGNVYEADARTVTVFTQDLAPEESITLRMDFLAPSGDVTGVTELWTTPTASAPGIHRYDTTYCE